MTIQQLLELYVNQVFLTLYVEKVITSTMTMFLIHFYSHFYAYNSKAFYKISPCGELMSVVGTVIRQTDPVALHYRHLVTHISRQLMIGCDIETIILDSVEVTYVS